MTDRVEGGLVRGFQRASVTRDRVVALENTLEQRVANLEFRINRYEQNLHNLEGRLQEALDDIAALRRPRDVRYVRGELRGRS